MWGRLEKIKMNGGKDKLSRKRKTKGMRSDSSRGGNSVRE